MRSYAHWQQRLSQAWQYVRTPVGLSISLHVCLIILVIIVGMTPAVRKQVLQVAAVTPNKPIVQAQVVNYQQYVAHQQVRNKQAAQAAKRAEVLRVQKRKAEQRAKLLEQKRAKALAKKRADALAKKRAEQKAKQQALKKKQQQLKLKKQKQLAENRRLVADKLKHQALSSIQNQINTDRKQQAMAAQSARMQTEKTRYMALIQQTVRANWINPFQDQDLQVTLLVTVDHKGVVQSVSVDHSSGNAAFDRQAIIAVRKSSPLPLPKDESLAKEFEVIKLPFSSEMA